MLYPLTRSLIRRLQSSAGVTTVPYFETNTICIILRRELTLPMIPKILLMITVKAFIHCTSRCQYVHDVYPGDDHESRVRDSNFSGGQLPRSWGGS